MVRSDRVSDNCGDLTHIQWCIQDFLREGSELSGGPRYPVSKTENSSNLVHYLLGGAQIPN